MAKGGTKGKNPCCKHWFWTWIKNNSLVRFVSKQWYRKTNCQNASEEKKITGEFVWLRFPFPPLFSKKNNNHIYRVLKIFVIFERKAHEGKSSAEKGKKKKGLVGFFPFIVFFLPGRARDAKRVQKTPRLTEDKSRTDTSHSSVKLYRILHILGPTPRRVQLLGEDKGRSLK